MSTESLDRLVEEINFSQEVKSAPEEPVKSSVHLNIVDVDEDEIPEVVEPVRGKLCINMIVKNESKIIERLLGSVLSIVDTYCICDTGSTDNTVDIIRAFMKANGKPGEVFVEPFKNFGYNRTVALERAARWGEYALLLDADMRLVISPEFDKAALTANGYSIKQKGGGLEYYNLRLCKTGIGVKCLCPTHEYYDFPNGGGSNKLETLFIDDIGDGGCKSDKFERDIRLLKAGLVEEPRNERYHFYLANSCRDLGKTEEAIEWYKKRVELGGWIEEVFYACYELGNQYKVIGDMPNAVFWWLEAYNRHPKRVESLYEAVKYYREKGKNHLAQILCDKARATPFPKDDVLFIRSDVYSHLLEYENSILAYYTGATIDHYRYLNLIGNEYNKGNVLSNYKFYAKKLKDHCVKDMDMCGTVEKFVGGRMDDFISSSPCIIPHSDGYILNVRYVNYKIRTDGSYAFKHDDGKITTLNLIQHLNRDLGVIQSHWIDEVQDERLRYQGVEDVKIFPHRGEILFCGTVEDPYTGRICVGRGKYDTNGKKLLSRPFASPRNSGCEKNWCYFHNKAGEMKMVYSWRPLTFAEPAEGDTVTLVEHDRDVPAVFRDFRGSSNGCLVGDDIWFLCHLVEYCTPRHYYHCLVVLDAATMKYKRHSILFKFHGDCIEYALGLVVEAERMLISYSRMDRTSAIMVVQRDVVERELFPTG